MFIRTISFTFLSEEKKISASVKEETLLAFFHMIMKNISAKSSAKF
jgi:hypothetical protein